MVLLFFSVSVFLYIIHLIVEGGMQLSCSPFVTTRTHCDYFVVFEDRVKDRNLKRSALPYRFGIDLSSGEIQFT